MTHCTLETDLRTLTDLELLSRTERLARVSNAPPPSGSSII